MSAIGQILACPKCDSMVHIAPPPGWVVPAMASSASLSSNALSVSSISLPRVEPETQQVPVAEATSPASPASSLSPLVIWGVGAAALVLVGGLVGFVMLRGSGTTENSAALVVAMADPPASTDLPATPPADEIAVETDTPTDVPTTDSPVEAAVTANLEPTEPAVAETTSSPATIAVAAEETNPKRDDPAPTTTASADALKSIGADTDSVVKDTTEGAAAPREPVLKFDPLDFDPAKLNLSSNTSSTNGTNAVSDPSTAAADKAAVDDKATPDADLLAGPAESPTITVRLGPATGDSPPPQRDVAKQLSLPVSGLDVAAVTLSRFIDMVADMADLPITLDPVALETVGLSPRETTKINVQNVTLDKLLRDTLESRHLAFVERDGQLVIAKPNSDRQRPVDYEVKDLLVAGETDASAIGALIQKFVVPASWKAGGTGTVRVEGTKLHVEQADGVQYQILIFCERLRIARGLPTRSRYPVARLNADTPYAKLAATISRETTFTFLPWTRLDEVTRQWQDASGVTVLVDWSALASAGLTPSSPLACSALNRPWSEAWDAILSPIGLGWWVVDGETIQITTQAALDEIGRVEFCAVPKPLRDQFTSADAMVELLTREITDHFNAAKNSPSPPQFTIVVDEPSGRLIVLGDAGVHRYLSERLNGKPK